MDVYFRDDQLNIVSICDDYIQFMWEEKLRGEGTFKIELPNTAYHRGNIGKYRLATIAESRRCMLITKYSYSLNGGAVTIVVEGVPVEQFLKNRWVINISAMFWSKIHLVARAKALGANPSEYETPLTTPKDNQGNVNVNNAKSPPSEVIPAGFTSSNSDSIAKYVSETKVGESDYSQFLLRIFVEGIFDSRLTLPRWRVRRDTETVDGGLYANTGQVDGTAFGAYKTNSVYKSPGSNKVTIKAETNALGGDSLDRGTGFTAWDLVRAAIGPEAYNHFEARFDEATRTIELVHVFLLRTKYIIGGQNDYLLLTPHLDTLSSANYTYERYTEPTVLYGSMIIDDEFDGKLYGSGAADMDGTTPNSNDFGYSRIEVGTKLDPPPKIPDGRYYGVNYMHGHTWEDPHGNKFENRALVLKRDTDAYGPPPTVDGHGNKTDNPIVPGQGRVRAFLDIKHRLSTVANQYRDKNFKGDATVNRLPGFEYNVDYFIGDKALVTFSDGDNPFEFYVRVTGYAWSVANGVVDEHPIFEQMV